MQKGHTELSDLTRGSLEDQGLNRGTEIKITVN